MPIATAEQIDRATEVLCRNWQHVERHKMTPQQLAALVVGAFLGEAVTIPLTQKAAST